MLKPLRLLGESLKQFTIGLLPATLLAFLCLAIQVAAGWGAINAIAAIVAPEPALHPDLDVMIQRAMERERDWQYDARQLLGYTLQVSLLFFFHVIVALIVTSWLIYRPHGLHPVTVFRGVFRRAVRGTFLLTGAAAVAFGTSYFFDNVYWPTQGIKFDFKSAAIVAVWFGFTALLLPARVMGHKPVAAREFLPMTLIATIALVPWFYASEVLGAPLRHCWDCGNILLGGLDFWVFQGIYWLGLTVSSAAVSAAACLPGTPGPRSVLLAPHDLLRKRQQAVR